MPHQLGASPGRETFGSGGTGVNLRRVGAAAALLPVPDEVEEVVVAAAAHAAREGGTGAAVGGGNRLEGRLVPGAPLDAEDLTHSRGQRPLDHQVLDRDVGAGVG